MTSPVQSPTQFAILTNPGEGKLHREVFSTAQLRLDRLRERAQARFPGVGVPRTPEGTSEDAYLAQLLGFFLMLKDGSVTLEDVTDLGE